MLSGGFINSVFKVTYSTPCSKKGVVIRVFTSNTDLLTVANEVVVSMRAAQLGGVGAEIIASFTNGIIYSFQVGEPLDPTNPKMDKHDVRK